MTTITKSTICYLEIPASKLEITSNFYRDIFDWEVTPSQYGEDAYISFSTGEGEISGGFNQNIPVQNEGVLLYLNVENIQETLKMISNNGGEILAEKFQISEEIGHAAYFKDPNGNQLALWSNV